MYYHVEQQSGGQRRCESSTVPNPASLTCLLRVRPKSVEALASGSYPDRFPLRASEMAQIGTGAMDMRSVEVWGRSIFVLDIQSRPRTIWSVLAEPGWLGFLVPLCWKGDYLFNKTAALPGNIFLVDSQSEYTSVYERRRALVLGLKRVPFEREVSNLRGTGPESFADGRSLLPTTHCESTPLIRLVQRVLLGTVVFERYDGKLLIPPVLETDLISAVADWAVSLGALRMQGIFEARAA